MGSVPSCSWAGAGTGLVLGLVTSHHLLGTALLLAVPKTTFVIVLFSSLAVTFWL